MVNALYSAPSTEGIWTQPLIPKLLLAKNKQKMQFLNNYIYTKKPELLFSYWNKRWPNLIIYEKLETSGH